MHAIWKRRRRRLEVNRFQVEAQTLFGRHFALALVAITLPLQRMELFLVTV